MIPPGDTWRVWTFLPFLTTSIIEPACNFYFTFHGPVHRSCTTLLTSLSRSMLLSDTFTKTRSPVQMKFPADSPTMVLLAFCLGLALLRWHFSSLRCTSLKFCLLSTNLSSHPVLFVLYICDTRVSKDLRGLRSSRSSNVSFFL